MSTETTETVQVPRAERTFLIERVGEAYRWTLFHMRAPTGHAKIAQSSEWFESARAAANNACLAADCHAAKLDEVTVDGKRTTLGLANQGTDYRDDITGFVDPPSATAGG